LGSPVTRVADDDAVGRRPTGADFLGFGALPDRGVGDDRHLGLVAQGLAWSLAVLGHRGGGAADGVALGQLGADGFACHRGVPGGDDAGVAEAVVGVPCSGGFAVDVLGLAVEFMRIDGVEERGAVFVGFADAADGDVNVDALGVAGKLMYGEGFVATDGLVGSRRHVGLSGERHI
jgi:hypothetical protein